MPRNFWGDKSRSTGVPKRSPLPKKLKLAVTSLVLTPFVPFRVFQCRRPRTARPVSAGSPRARMHIRLSIVTHLCSDGFPTPTTTCHQTPSPIHLLIKEKTIYMCIYIYIYIYILIYGYSYRYRYIYIYTHPHTHVYACVYIYIYIHVYTQICIGIYESL